MILPLLRKHPITAAPMIKSILATLLAVVPCSALLAQSEADPIVMTVGGVPVPRSEFEYSYNKNNTDGVIDKKTVEEYVDLFVNYKLKVLAALKARLDTTQAFKTSLQSGICPVS